MSLTFLIAVFVSNVPESLASTRGMLETGYRRGPVLGLWLAVALLSGIVAAFGASSTGSTRVSWRSCSPSLPAHCSP